MAHGAWLCMTGYPDLMDSRPWCTVTGCKETLTENAGVHPVSVFTVLCSCSSARGLENDFAGGNSIFKVQCCCPGVKCQPWMNEPWLIHLRGSTCHGSRGCPPRSDLKHINNMEPLNSTTGLQQIPNTFLFIPQYGRAYQHCYYY